MPKVNLKVPPTGAFYMFSHVSTYNEGDNTPFLCLDLLNEK